MSEVNDDYCSTISPFVLPVAVESVVVVVNVVMILFDLRHAITST